MKLTEKLIKEAFTACGVPDAAPKAITIVKKKTIIAKPKKKTEESEKEAKDKVEKVMGEFKRGKLKSSSGQKVTDRKQAIAIALSEKRRAKKAAYTDFVEKDERAAAIKMGMFMRYMASGEHPDKVDEMMKSAQLGDLPEAGAKMVVLGSLATGIPIGIMAHLIHNRIKSTNRKERLMDEQIKHYRQAGEELESGLAQAGATL